MVQAGTYSSVTNVHDFELKDVLTPTVSAPRLWIQRLVLLERPSIDAVIRDIPLTRGLNIIVGKTKQNDSQKHSPTVFSDSGHSVGKTTLCRLIRYLLGEQNFGTQKAQELIRGNFPEGWAAGEVVIDGEVWAIARPFSARFKTKVAKDISIEELLKPGCSGIGYGEYENSLRQLLPPHANLPSITFEWKHLLAWIARDQESRLRDFWAWRDKGSESKTSFPAPVEHPRHLARAIFKMVSSETERLESSVSELKIRLNRAKEELDHQIVTPSLRLENAKRYLKNLLSVDAIRLAETGGPLFSYEMQSQTEIERLDSIIANKQKKLSEIDDKLARLVPIIQNLIKNIEISSPAVNFQMGKIQSIEDPDDDPDEHRLRSLEKKINYKCDYIPSIKIKDCPEVQKELKRLSSKKIIQIDQQKRKKLDKNSLIEYSEQLKAAQDTRRQEIDYYNESVDLKDDLLKKRNLLISEIDTTTRKCSEIKFYIDEHKKYSQMVDGSIVNKDIEMAKQKIDELSAELSLENACLESEKKNSASHTEHISNIFSLFTKIVLGEACSGIINEKNDLSFSIVDSEELSGAVVDTVSIILGDVTAMVCSSQGSSLHPGLLIHDSPREADLAPGLYSNIFYLIFKLVTFFNKNDLCPFQYIITTTTSAPEWATPFVKQRLASSPEIDYLFKRKLTSQIKPIQLPFET